MRDQSGAISVDAPEIANKVRPGDLVALQGRSQDVDFAPEVRGTQVTVLGKAPIGATLHPTYQQMASTELDSQWVEVQGVVHAVLRDPDYAKLDISVPGGSVVAKVTDLSEAAARALVDAKVNIRGHLRRDLQCTQSMGKHPAVRT